MSNQQAIETLRKEYVDAIFVEKRKLWDLFISGDTVSVSSLDPVVFNEEEEIDTRWSMFVDQVNTLYDAGMVYRKFIPKVGVEYARFNKLEREYATKLNTEITKAKDAWNQYLLDSRTLSEMDGERNHIHEHADDFRSKLSMMGYIEISDSIHDQLIKDEVVAKLNEKIAQGQVAWNAAVFDKNRTVEEIQQIMVDIATHTQEWRDKIISINGNVINNDARGLAKKKEVTDNINKEIVNIRLKIWAARSMPGSQANRDKLIEDLTNESLEWRAKGALISADLIPNGANIPEEKEAKALYEKYGDGSIDTPISEYNEKNNKTTRDYLYKYYKSFSGTDAIAELIFPGEKHIVLGEVSTLSYSIYRDKQSVKTLGRISTRGFTKGSRTVAGTLVFTVTNEHWVNQVRDMYPNIFSGIRKIKADELPPFDLIINYANEYGASAYYAIYGLTIIEEGQVVSTEDSMTENVCKFMARDIDNNTPHTIGGFVDDRVGLRDPNYDLLGKYEVVDLVSDDSYEMAKRLRDKLIAADGNNEVTHPQSMIEKTAIKNSGVPLITKIINETGNVELDIYFYDKRKSRFGITSDRPVTYVIKANYDENNLDTAEQVSDGVTNLPVINIPVLSLKKDNIVKDNVYLFIDYTLLGTTRSATFKIDTSNPRIVENKPVYVWDITVA